MGEAGEAGGALAVWKHYDIQKSTLGLQKTSDEVPVHKTKGKERYGFIES